MALAFVVADVVNRAYAHAETELFLTKIDRTVAGDVTASISRRETAVALVDGVVVGSIRAATLDERTSWFGALGVDPVVRGRGRGLGDTLVTFVEDDAAGAGKAEMQLDVFDSQPEHLHLSRIRAWYEGRGYDPWGLLSRKA
jgi:GNAT superfamily N-acetyltransferase